MYRVYIIADSVSPAGKRLTTFELTYPRFVHAELMTHRLFSRNSASSRAIPAAKLQQRIREDPVMPLFWGENQAGMQAKNELPPDKVEQAKTQWLIARDQALGNAELLVKLGVHKQLVNRLIEPWMFITVLVTATEFDNWFYLRDSEFAQPEIAWVAREMKKEMENSLPQPIRLGEWHMPLLLGREAQSPVDWDYWTKVSTGRCARVSYLTHDGKRDPEEDIRLCDQLAKNGHWSPFEHVATPLDDPDKQSGNFFGWKQYRKFFENEHYGRRMK